MTRITTDNQTRNVFSVLDLSPTQREQYDLDAATVESMFFGFGGEVYNLEDFTVIRHDDSRNISCLNGWDAYLSTSAFTAILIKIVYDDNTDTLVVVGEAETD